jgi:16S rRNA (guanine966-N2)-methyltransferase
MARQPTAARKRAEARPPAAPGRVRIVGGLWKRTPLAVPAVAGLRPTPDRVRETVFNWLGQTLDGVRCLDLFAGSGALGLEAASRGAASVVMVERDATALAAIRDVVQRLGATDRIRILGGDSMVHLERLTRDAAQFDLVFVDPPYGSDLAANVLERLPAVLAPGARIYVENDSPIPIPGGFETLRAARAGQVHYHLLGWPDAGLQAVTP